MVRFFIFLLSLIIVGCKSTSDNVCEEFPGHYPENYTYIPDEVAALVRIMGAYPEEALEKKLEGFVKLSFDVVNGRARNIKVLESTNKVFEKTAVTSLKYWKYQTAYRNCVLYPKVYPMETTIKFDLENLVTNPG